MGGRCWYCGAPPWSGFVESRWTVDDRPGVYVLATDVGMYKIGMSQRGVAGRVEHLIGRAARSGVRCWLEFWLPGASPAIERWLHQTLADTRDRSWARAELLPHPSEWFWPTPALRALADGDWIVDHLTPEFIA